MAIDDAELASADYWNHRYGEIGAEEAYDWFRDGEQLGAWLKDHLSRPDAKVLHLGCGNSVGVFRVSGFRFWFWGNRCVVVVGDVFCDLICCCCCGGGGGIGMVSTLYFLFSL